MEGLLLTGPTQSSFSVVQSQQQQYPSFYGEPAKKKQKETNVLLEHQIFLGGPLKRVFFVCG